MSDAKTTIHDLPRAPVWRKLAALVYDSLILAAVSMAYGALAFTIKYRVLGYVLSDGEKGNLGLPGFIGWALVLIAFYCFFWRRGGQTIGMRAWRLVMVDSNRRQPSLVSCIIRALVAPFSLFLVGAGFWWQLIDKEHLTWHDRMSGTQVLLLPKNKK